MKKRIRLPLAVRWCHQVAGNSRNQGTTRLWTAQHLNGPPPRLQRESSIAWGLFSIEQGILLDTGVETDLHRIKRGLLNPTWTKTSQILCPCGIHYWARIGCFSDGRKGGKREQLSHLSHATPSSLVHIIYGVIWAASNLIKGHSKLTNRFKWTEAISAQRSLWKELA